MTIQVGDSRGSEKRTESASIAAQSVSAVVNVFGQLMLLIAGIGGVASEFGRGGILAALLFLVIWLVIGAAIVGFGFSVLNIVLGAVTYGIVWIVYPDSWPTILRWLAILPAAMIGFILATALNIIFRFIEIVFPFHGLTALVSLFFVSFAQTTLAIIAAGWIAPAAKHTVRVILTTLFVVIALIAALIVLREPKPSEIPVWASLVATLLSAVGAIAATVIMSKSSAE